MISVLIAEPNLMSCELMAAAIERSPYALSVVAREVSSTGAIERIKLKQPAVSVISAGLHDGPLAGYMVLRELRSSGSSTRPVMLLESPERNLVIEAFRCGAQGVFCRDEPIEALCKCIHVVHQEQIWASSKELHYLLDAFAEAVPPGPNSGTGADSLTKREIAVVHLVAEGLTNREISRHLQLSEHTVRNYLFRIFDKLGISSRVELVLFLFNQRDSDPLRWSAGGAGTAPVAH